MTFSIVIPVYKNEESLPALLDALSDLAEGIWDSCKIDVEAVFVVDGSPDRSFEFLAEKLSTVNYTSKLLLHSRNFGSFAAIRTGLSEASGEYFAVLAADLQEPPDLMRRFLQELAADECDVVVGCRQGRQDPGFVRITSTIFWFFYRKFVMVDMPSKGVDVFACNRRFRDELLKLSEANSSLVGQIFWLGFRRQEIYYTRQERKYGKSAWTFQKKVTYFLDSVFSFTDLPIRLLGLFGAIAVALSVALSVAVTVAKCLGTIRVSGYTATVLAILFFGGINAIGLSIVGSYAWRTFENTKQRPTALVMDSRVFGKRDCRKNKGL
jgi:glycosyltransferase involved in cell wall biosynthesis